MSEFCPPPGMDWLPAPQHWLESLKAARAEADPVTRFQRFVALTHLRLDQTQTAQLDRTIQAAFPNGPPEQTAVSPLRLALVGSSTQVHLHAAIRIAGLRRGLWVQIAQADYGAHLQALASPDSPLRAEPPDAVLIGLDSEFAARYVRRDWTVDAAAAGLEDAIADLRTCWSAARALSSCVVQQSFAPVFPAILGNNEQRLPASRAGFLTRLNVRLRSEADAAGVDVLALDEAIARHGLDAWWDPVFWHTAKQEVRPAAAPMYGELLARLLAARRGLSRKCLVLDLDNTLWGGVVGDDGLEQLALGQGSASGEAFLDVQRYALDQAARGVVLAVCSKNEEAVAWSVFDHHPEMLLRRSDIHCLVANWNDKATNLRLIAERLKLGLASLVFVDDNPFERDLVRQTLPMVAVPELPDDPALFARTVADAGYFESVDLTDEDLHRARLYAAEVRRASERAEAPSLETYLEGLDMRLDWRTFEAADRKRIVQLINKTNQFNLTTRRYDDQQVQALERADDAFGMRFRLRDRFGDHGLIAVVICRGRAGEAVIDSWLMSCRVLGRGLDEAVMTAVVGEARRRGFTRLVGQYRATAANAMVRDHYDRLGFTPIASEGETACWACELDGHQARDTFVTISEN